MKEISDIIIAFGQAQKEGKRTALATVVHVDGSSYRRPGARMLVTEDGQLTGAISGGCLEGDALRKAQFAIISRQNKLVTYDTTDEDDLKFGVQLGCNGLVRILFEPIEINKENNPIYLLKQLTGQRQNAVLVTGFSLDHVQQPGTCLLYLNDQIETTLPDHVQEHIMTDVRTVLTDKASRLKEYQTGGQIFKAFIEFICPPIALVIAGAGNDAQPLSEMGCLLGWHTTILDGRQAYATTKRFPKADKVLIAKPGMVLSQLRPDAQTVFLLMTHNYNYDLALLKELMGVDYLYIGMLGPAKKRDRMFQDLQEQGLQLTEAQRSKIYGPAGLDIGAETAEEIAVSIIAEIKAVLSGREGSSLRQKQDSIHDRLLYPSNT
jgi:xanthine/CO dehydrogenase XdhC/CoxF family maturation factor